MKTFSLRARLTLLLAGATVVALGIAARVVDWRADSEMHQRFDASLLARAQAFAELVRSGDNAVDVDAGADRVARFPAGASDDWYVVTCRDTLVARSTPPAPRRTPPGDAPEFWNARSPEGRELRVVALRFRLRGQQDGTTAMAAEAGKDIPCELSYALDRGPLADILRTLDLILVGSIIGACALVLLLTPWLVRRGLRPLDSLDTAMARIGPDAPGERVPETRTTELVPLVDRFNEVLGRMDAGLARERQFASGLAHEFRTRIAELRALVDVEALHPSGRAVNQILAEVGAISAELETTVAALLQLTRIQSGLASPKPERVSLPALLARLCSRHQDLADARGLRIEGDYATDPAATIKVDPALLEVILDNLLGNAVAYAPAGSTVSLRARPGVIEVCNPAPGMGQEDLENLGRRFWRKNEQGTGHAGLGLALATASARAMEAELGFVLRDGCLHAVLMLARD